MFRRGLAAAGRAASSLVSLFSFLMVVRTGLLLVVDSNSACWPLAMSARVVTSSLIWRWISAARAYRAAAVAGSVTSSGGLAQVVSWPGMPWPCMRLAVPGFAAASGPWLVRQGGVAVQASGGLAGVVS